LAKLFSPQEAALAGVMSATPETASVIAGRAGVDPDVALDMLEGMTAVARSDFYAVVDAESCIGCGACVERCLFGALSVPEDVSSVDLERCVGCGLCATVCPVDAMHLARRPAEEVPLPPVDEDEWWAQRGAARSIPRSEPL
jgi:ferredoxin